MSQAKSNLFYLVAVNGLASANRGNPFWSQSSAMALINATRNNGAS